ncbi:MAG: hypothetical protein JXA46_03555 [Dehalococcoidales bacterium]|nr:hypothetical protein [Dehalococcoidales bacterium]
MQTVREWKTETPNPDENLLKAEAEAETEESSIVMEASYVRDKDKNIESLIKASGLSKQDLNRKSKESENASRASLRKNSPLLLRSPFDIDARHNQDIELAKRTSDLIKSKGDTCWQGYIWNACNCGYWSEFNGESEEVPSIKCNKAKNLVEPKAQAFGEGWYDTDFSKIHAYLSFSFSPPSWGGLQITANPWVHGYYYLYSDDDWYNDVYAYVVFTPWIQIHQNVWRPRNYYPGLVCGGQEIHPVRYGRIDKQYSYSYFTQVGEKDTVTISIGVYLYCKARASGSLSVLDFKTGDANYIYIPYIHWSLYQ